MSVIRLKNGTEIPVFPLGMVDRLALYDVGIDCANKPALQSVWVFAALGLAWETAAAKEARVPLADRSVPEPKWKVWPACGGDLYAYGAGVVDALAAGGEDIITLRAVAKEITTSVWMGFHPPKEAIEQARKNSDSEAAKSSVSSDSGSAT